MTLIGSDSEETLILEMQRGDKKAMRAAYDRYVGYLTAVCSRYVVVSEDVCDVLQNSFIKIFLNINQYKPRENASLKSWMTKIVVNESLKFLKDGNRFSFIERTDELPDVPDEYDEFDEVPFDVIMEMVKSLPDGYRTVFNLFIFEHKSHKEIAAILNIKENTSAIQLYRAKAMLAKNIRQYLTIAI